VTMDAPFSRLPGPEGAEQATRRQGLMALFNRVRSLPPTRSRNASTWSAADARRLMEVVHALAAELGHPVSGQLSRAGRFPAPEY